MSDSNFTVSHDSKRMLTLRNDAHKFDIEQPSIHLNTNALGYTASVFFTRIEDLQQLVLQATGLLSVWQQEIEEEAS